MLESLELIFNTSGFPARWYCGGGWTSLHGWTHIISDLAIWAAYFTIPVVLVYYVIKRPDVPFPRMFWLFGLFILACGTGHLVEATIFWHPWYRLSALVKVVTAMASWATVAAIVPVIPKALTLPGLSKINDDLMRQIEERRQAEESRRASEERLHLALECAAMGTWSYDRRGGRITGDGRFGRLLHRESNPVDLKLDEFLMCVQPDDRDRVKGELEGCLAEQGELEMEWHIGEAASRRTIRARGTVHRPGNGTASISGVAWDITAQQQATENDRMLAAIVESTHDAVISVDLNGTILSWNKGATMLYGYASDEAVGRDLAVITAAEPQGELPARLKLVASGRHSGPFETIRHRNDGTPIDVVSTISPVWSAQGKVIRASVISQNITPRKQAERSLLESEARKAAILGSALDGIVTMDHEGKVVEFNPAAARMFGCSREQVIGRHVAEIMLPPHLREQHRHGLAQYLATGESAILDKRLEMPAINAEGEEFPVEIAVTRVEIPGPPVFTAFIRDIADRRQAEEQFHLAVEASPNGMVMVNGEGKIILVNVQTERMFGYSRAELLGQSVDMLVPVRFREEHPTNRREFFAQPQSRAMGAGRDLFGVRKDGAEFPVEIGLNPIETTRGMFVLSSIVDITERKKSEEALLKTNERLVSVNKELEQFVYSVSHDLKSPLVTVEGFSGHLLSDLHAGRNDRLNQFTIRIQDAVRKMCNTIDALLEVSRVGRVIAEPESVSIHLLVGEWISDHRDQIDSIQATFTVQDELPVIRGDRLRLVQVFDNVLTNALKYGCEGADRRVIIGATRWGREVRIFVRDHGPGIPKEFHEKIFELFERLHRDDKGTGVGLNLAKRAAEVNGGRLWVESGIDQGATFWVAFPTESILLESNF